MPRLRFDLSPEEKELKAAMEKFFNHLVTIRTDLNYSSDGIGVFFVTYVAQLAREIAYNAKAFD